MSKMVEIIENESQFDDDPVSQETFLSSIKSWYPQGIHIGVEKFYMNEKDGKWGKYLSIALKCSILEDMEKCRARVIGKDGKVVMTEDAMGNEIAEIQIIKDPQEVTLFLSVKFDDENDELLRIGGFQAVADFIRPCFQASGLIPSDFKGGFKCTVDELKDCLEAYECKVHYGKNDRAKFPHAVAVNL